MRVGLAEISPMTPGRENDASSSSHPEPSPRDSQVRQHSRYLSPSVQPRSSMWLSTPCRAQTAWTEATDVRQRAFRFFSSSVFVCVQCNCSQSLVVAFYSQNVQSPSFSPRLSVCLQIICSALSWHHLADDSGIPISNYKQDLGSIRLVR